MWLVPLQIPCKEFLRDRQEQRRHSYRHQHLFFDKAASHTYPACQQYSGGHMDHKGRLNRTVAVNSGQWAAGSGQRTLPSSFTSCVSITLPTFAVPVFIHTGPQRASTSIYTTRLSMTKCFQNLLRDCAMATRCHDPLFHLIFYHTHTHTSPSHP
ncbi:uncharacterized protein BO72DRAFT_74711 [Aspergillus fijiensis CBS 313.89]|uniref:Uncharacterized protein n=1 Tax=Aspergillus fijiensis CBS 313.89 TaxID=1448319 RepID=A0A8G1RUC8_9EURO|nr:uncharacterized protein BO72DRAFT_74711 [Aspergillus fijiensis CBS 313.89]RAK78473.1 hypothetical protein BO72DRAFT_74711 [Aspergillus fijiensis CBS 313.89]